MRNLRRLGIAVLALGGSTLASCEVPETTVRASERCSAEADSVECMNRKIIGDTGRNALVGGIIGAAAGTAIGIATHNPHTVAIGAASAVTTAGVAGIATYYIEHTEANALQDIVARNRQLSIEIQVYETKNSQLERDAQTINLQMRNAQSTSDAEIKSLRDELKYRRKFIEQLTQAISALEEQLRDFKLAVNAKFKNLPDEISDKIAENTKFIAKLQSIRDTNIASERDTFDIMRKKGWLE